MQSKYSSHIELAKDYSFVVRFALLIFIWGIAADDYRLLLNLSLIGVILVALFFATNILVFFGYKTRISMAILAMTMAIHGAPGHDIRSLLCAALALGSLALPIGRYYSLDRYLELGRKPVLPYQPSAEALAQPLHLSWKIAFVAWAAFLIGGPAYNQIFHHDNRMFIKWDMFHRRAQDLVIVQFFDVRGSERNPVDYLTTLGHKIKRPEVRFNAHNADFVITGVLRLDDVITRVCKTVPTPQSLRLEAKIATLKAGWQTLYDGSESICTASGTAMLKTFPKLETGIPGAGRDFWDDGSEEL